MCFLFQVLTKPISYCIWNVGFLLCLIKAGFPRKESCSQVLVCLLNQLDQEKSLTPQHNDFGTLLLLRKSTSQARAASPKWTEANGSPFILWFKAAGCQNQQCAMSPPLYRSNNSLFTQLPWYLSLIYLPSLSPVGSLIPHQPCQYLLSHSGTPTAAGQCNLWDSAEFKLGAGKWCLKTSCELEGQQRKSSVVSEPAPHPYWESTYDNCVRQKGHNFSNSSQCCTDFKPRTTNPEPRSHSIIEWSTFSHAWNTRYFVTSFVNLE